LPTRRSRLLQGPTPQPARVARNARLNQKPEEHLGLPYKMQRASCALYGWG
jgi:hypothetical protein